MANPTLVRRASWTGAIVLGALWLAWQVFADGRVGSLAQRDPTAALAWRAEAAPALLSAADARLAAAAAPGDYAAVIGLARRAMVSNPLDARAWRLLGLAAERSGDLALADASMAIAAKRSRRDGLVEAWRLQRAIAEGDALQMLAAADVLWRTRPQLAASLASVFVGLAETPDGRIALVDALASDPPWRAWLFGELAQRATAPTTPYAVLVGLQTTANPPRAGELGAYLARLIREEAFELAFLTWLEFLPAERRGSVAYAYNGGFEDAVSGLPFDWSIGATQGATSTVVADAERAGKVLKVEFANTRVAYQHVAKLLFLPPGAYRLDGMARLAGLESERGLVWRIVCAEGERPMLGASRHFLGTSDWAAFAVEFAVPHAGCRAQWLRLQLDARTAVESAAGGTAYFDDLTIARAGS